MRNNNKLLRLVYFSGSEWPTNLLQNMATGQLFQLEQDEELRIEADFPKTEEVTVELRAGTAEVFGTEMVQNKVYRFQQGAKFSVFTYDGCQVMVRGRMEVQPYTSKETPMIMYLNVHAALEQMRKNADVSGLPSPEGRGPIVMVVGPADVGKSTLCRKVKKTIFTVDMVNMWLGCLGEIYHRSFPDLEFLGFRLLVFPQMLNFLPGPIISGKPSRLNLYQRRSNMWAFSVSANVVVVSLV